ncbi:MAG: Gfo/Idh/MocA family oxidoreductase [Clostridia bacterium]|nr:Gfo/Idh/MocA family oxidoreductase [Clostridia bacterium]
MSDAVLSQFKQAAVEETKVDTNKKLKVGIIGTGWIAESHIQSYKIQPDVEIVAAADLIPGKAEKFMERFGVSGVRFYPSHKEMIDNEELDAVSICTYNTQHAEPTIYSLKKGIPVLLEKPFTVTLEEAEEV